MPTLSNKHSNGSALPDAIAILGMSAKLPSPSVRFFGRRLLAGAMTLLVHAVTVGKRTLRRHLPIWTTSGMLVPEGTLVLSVNFPSGPVWAIEMAEMVPV